MTTNILNGTKWQQLRDTRDSAYSVITYITDAYDKVPTTTATLNIYNSLNNLRNNNVTIAQLCEWVELNQGARIKNKKDFRFITNTIIDIA